MTSEARGQNSWVSYGKHNRDASTADTIYADQKARLLPEWAWTEGFVDDTRAHEQGQTRAERPGLGVSGPTGEVRVAATELDAPPVNDDGTITLDHFGPEGVTQTDPAMCRRL